MSALKLLMILVGRIRSEFVLTIVLLIIWIPFDELYHLWPAFIIAGVTNILPSTILVFNYLNSALNRNNDIRLSEMINLDGNHVVLISGMNEFAWGGNFEFIRIMNNNTRTKYHIPFCNTYQFDKIKSLKLIDEHKKVFFPFIK